MNNIHIFVEKARNNNVPDDQILHELIWFWGYTKENAEKVIKLFDKKKADELMKAKNSWGGVF